MSTVKLPKVTSTFAIVEIKLGRHQIRKLAVSGHEIPFTLTGVINPGRSGIGPADNVGTEFAADVKTIKLGKPKYIPCDKHGRPYALASEMRAGVVLECDGGFTCMKANSRHVVKRRAGRLKGVSPEYAKDPFARLYIDCKDGGHSLDGQLGDHGELRGLYRVKAR